MRYGAQQPRGPPNMHNEGQSICEFTTRHTSLAYAQFPDGCRVYLGGQEAGHIDFFYLLAYSANGRGMYSATESAGRGCHIGHVPDPQSIHAMDAGRGRG
jgi:hypothetical protein